MTPLKELQSVERLRERVVELRAKRGVMLMDGEGVDSITTEIGQAISQADALQDLEAAESKRAYAEAAEKQRAGRSVQQKQLDHFTDQALLAVQDAELAMRSFVAAYKSIRSLYYASAQVKSAMGGEIPSTWSLFELNTRFGFRVGALLAEIDSRSRQRLGPVGWSLHGLHTKDVDWVQSESVILEKELNK